MKVFERKSSAWQVALSVVLSMIMLLAVALMGRTSFASAEEVGVNTWKKMHNEDAELIVDDDNNVIMKSTGTGKVNNDVAFVRTDETYKIKQDGFYIRFTYQEFDAEGNPVEKMDNKNTIRFVFSDQAEIGEAQDRSTLVTRLNLYYDDATAKAPNTITKRNEASINYWGSKYADPGFTIDNWFVGTPYGGHFYADGKTENTFLLKWENRDGEPKLWACLNDFWFEANKTPEGVENETADQNTWAGCQGQAHSYIEEKWVSTPGMSELLDELDAANEGKGAYCGIWDNHVGSTTDVNIKVTAMGSPKQEFVTKVTKDVNIGEQTLYLPDLFNQPNFDNVVYTVTDGTAAIGTIADNTWKYNFAEEGVKAITVTATVDNNGLGSYFPAVRDTKLIITYNVTKPAPEPEVKPEPEKPEVKPEPETPAPEVKPETKPEEKGGCGSAVGFSGAMLGLILCAGCAVVLLRKKEN